MSGSDLEIIMSSNLTLGAAANIIGISRQSIYAWIAWEELRDRDIILIEKMLNPHLNDVSLSFLNTLVRQQPTH